MLIGWNITSRGEIKVLAYDNNTNFNWTNNLGRCYFRVTSYYLARKVVYASQRIVFDGFTLLITAGLARYHASADVQCFGSQYVVIELAFIDDKDLRETAASSGKKNSFASFLNFVLNF